MEVFREDERFTDVGLRLSSEIEAALAPVFRRYLDEKIKIRDLAAIAHLTIHEIECEMILAKNDEA